jgi:hypothetical protein
VAAVARNNLGYALLPLVLPIFVTAKWIDERGVHRLGLTLLGCSFFLFAVAAVLLA